VKASAAVQNPIQDVKYPAADAGIGIHKTRGFAVPLPWCGFTGRRIDDFPVIRYGDYILRYGADFSKSRIVRKPNGEKGSVSSPLFVEV
jgi:hypothetical protein